MVLALAVAGASSTFVQTVLVPIQVRLPEFLNASRADTAWAITVTLLVGAVANPIWGRLADLYGKRKMALVSLAALVVGSVLCAIASDIVPMIIGRGLQGLGVTIVPIGIGILRDWLPAQRLVPSIALLSSTVGIGAALGLPLSAAISGYLDWHMNFWIATVLALAAFVMVWVAVPRVDKTTQGKFDVLGSVVLSVGLVALLLVVSRGNEWGWASPLTLVVLIGSIVVLVLWGALQLRTDSPLVDLRLTARRPILFTGLATVCLGFASFASTVVFPQQLVLSRDAGGMGLTLLTSSLYLMSLGIAILVVSPVAGRVARARGPRVVLLAGACVLIVAYALATALTLQAWHIIVLNALIGVGIACGLSSLPALIVQSVPPERTSAGTGLNQLLQSLGSTVAAAGTGAIIAVTAIGAGISSIPTQAGFTWSLFAGLCASVICLLFAILIPARKSGVDHV